MKTQILTHIPGLCNTEVDQIITEYSTTKIEVCQSCRGEIKGDDLISELVWSGGWDSPDEYTSMCPHCFEKEPVLDRPTLEEFLYIEEYLTISK